MTLGSTTMERTATNYQALLLLFLSGVALKNSPWVGIAKRRARNRRLKPLAPELSRQPCPKVERLAAEGLGYAHNQPNRDSVAGPSIMPL